MIDRSLNYGRHHIKRFLKAAAPLETVLDIGAGLGADLEAAREVSPNARLVALEVYKPYIDILESKGIETVQFDLEREAFPFPDGSLDVVIANQIIEHVKEIFWIFHQVSRTLKVGGRFVIGVPNLASFHCRMMLLSGLHPTIIKAASAHVRGWTKRDLLRFVNACAPGVYEQRGFGGGNFYPLPPVLAKPMATILPNMAWAVFLSLEKVKEYDGGFLKFPVEKQLETSFFVG